MSNRITLVVLAIAALSLAMLAAAGSQARADVAHTPPSVQLTLP